MVIQLLVLVIMEAKVLPLDTETPLQERTLLPLDTSTPLQDLALLPLDTAAPLVEVTLLPLEETTPLQDASLQQSVPVQQPQPSTPKSSDGLTSQEQVMRQLDLES